MTLAGSKPAEELAQLKLVAGCRVSGPLTTAFAAVSGGDARAVDCAVARRAWQQLASMAPLLSDLASLCAAARAAGDEQRAALYDGLFRQYRDAISEAYPSEALRRAVENDASGQAAGRGNALLAVTFRAWKKMLLWDAVLAARPTAAELGVQAV